jgi:5-methylcytosine-specific restriction endonuclease McrA
MSCVFVIDQEQRPLDPVHPGRARFLLSAGHAAVWRRYPFTLILKDQSAEASPPTPLRLKIDPGSKTTGLALVNDTTGQVVWAGELTHRGQQVTKHLDHRRACRRSRRRRHTRYRAARFLNRRRPAGWLPPSLESRLANVLTWVRRLQRLCCIGALSQELVRFDMQLLQNPDISGEEYQHGTLAGYELREYVLETMGRRCVYCDKENVPLQLDHLLPRSRGGPTRASNLAPACVPCNQKKGNRTGAEFGYPEVESRANVPLRDAAAVNVTRWALFHQLDALGLPLETGSGGRTKWNRHERGLPKTHWLDAACTGASTPAVLCVQGVVPLLIQAQGRHSRQMRRTNAAGFPDKAPKATSVVAGFRTGDMVRAVVPLPSKKVGTYIGRIAIRATGFCNVATRWCTVEGIHVQYCRPLHRGDGYSYAKGAALPPQA